MLVKRWNWEGLSCGNAEEQMIMLLPRHIRVYSVWYCRYKRSVDTLVIPSSLWDWARSSISAFLRLSALLIIPGRRPATMTMSSSSINSERLEAARVCSLEGRAVIISSQSSCKWPMALVRDQSTKVWLGKANVELMVELVWACAQSLYYHDDCSHSLEFIPS